jgi:hypothetical protein
MPPPPPPTPSLSTCPPFLSLTPSSPCVAGRQLPVLAEGTVGLSTVYLFCKPHVTIRKMENVILHDSKEKSTNRNLIQEGTIQIVFRGRLRLFRSFTDSGQRRPTADFFIELICARQHAGRKNFIPNVLPR